MVSRLYESLNEASDYIGVQSYNRMRDMNMAFLHQSSDLLAFSSSSSSLQETFQSEYLQHITNGI